MSDILKLNCNWLEKMEFAEAFTVYGYFFEEKRLLRISIGTIRNMKLRIRYMKKQSLKLLGIKILTRPN